MDLHSLIGFVLEGCRFSKSSYTFEFSGLLDGRHLTLSASTAYSVSAIGDAKVDLCEGFSRAAWPLLERRLVRIEADAEACEIRFEFGEGQGFAVWSEGDPIDNLLLVRDGGSGDWFTVL